MFLNICELYSVDAPCQVLLLKGMTSTMENALLLLTVSKKVQFLSYFEKSLSPAVKSLAN